MSPLHNIKQYENGHRKDLIERRQNALWYGKCHDGAHSAPFILPHNNGIASPLSIVRDATVKPER